jgi:TonB-dependent starch-binding outer membrane protein SusC
MKKVLLQLCIMLSKLFLYGFFAQVFFMSILIAYDGNAQNRQSVREVKFSIKSTTHTLHRIFQLIERDTQFRFFLDENFVDKKTQVVLDYPGETVADVLMEISKQTNLKFRQINNVINVSVKESTETEVIKTTFTEEQTLTVTGQVTSMDSPEGLPGVNVVIKGTSQGTVTDVSGRYSIEVSSTDNMLVFSSIGFISQEILVGNNSIINITMQADITALEEVVVVGYGAIKKRDITGSVASVSADNISKVPTPNIDQALQGMASGVLVTSVDGSPGSQSTIRIRGGNSINAGNEPLWVVDGFISDRSIVTALDPGDIQSIEVLKDASAAAIYGARGSNGVILVTTKRGETGKSVVEFSTSYGVQNLARRVPVMGAQDYITWANQGEGNLGNALVFDDEDKIRIGNGTDWQRELTRSAPILQTKIAFSGGTEKTKFYLSGNYFNQDGILKGNNFERGIYRINLDHKVSKHFEVGTQLNVSSITDNPIPYNWENVVFAPPTLPVRNPDGSYSDTSPITGRPFNNPVSQIEFIDREVTTNQVIGNTYMAVNFLKNFRLRSSLGFMRSDRRSNDYISSQLPTNILQSRPGEGSVSAVSRNNVLFENTLNYGIELGGNHRLDVLAGITTQREEMRGNVSSSIATLTDLLSVYGIDLSSPEFTNVSTMYQAFSLLSYIGRVNYAFKNKYLLTLTARQDGSSKFGTDNRYAFFPAVALGWVISDETFIQDLNVFDFLKMRLSYGQTGNSDGIGAFERFQAMSTVFGSLGRGVSEVGVQNNVLANSRLRWETTEQYDLGLEFGLFKSRLNFELDVYYSKTNDLLFTREVPSQTGFATRLENVGSLENKGIDFSVNAKIIEKNDFGWDFGLNISTYRNKVLSLGSEVPINTYTFSTDPISQLIAGKPLGIFTGYQTRGIYRDQNQVDEDGFANNYRPGELRMVDQNNDGLINRDGDLTIIGDSNPDFFGGFQNNLRFKNLQLSAFFQYSYGNDVYNRPRVTMTQTQAGSAYQIYTGAWTSENPDALIPAINAPNSIGSNDLNVEDGSFLRLRTLELAYNLPVKNLNLPVSNARMYLQGTNVFQLISSSFNGDDPETNAFGTDDRLRGFYNLTYPYPRTFVLGIDVRF